MKSFWFGENEKQNLISVGRCALLALALLLLCLLQNCKGLFPRVFGANAILLVPAVACIAMFEKDIGGMLFGLFAGALWDISGSKGDFNAIILVIVGFVCGSLLNNLMRPNIITAVLLSAGSLAFHCAASWAVTCVFNPVDGALKVLTAKYLPSFIWSLILSPLIFIVFSFIENRFSPDRSVHGDLDSIQNN